MKKNYAIVDTETLGGASDAYVHTYDLSAVAYDRNGIWLDSIQIVILENLILDTAYYGKFKKNFYKSLLRMPSTTICYTEAEAEEVFLEWAEDNEITTLCAHNSGFDFTKTFLRDSISDFEFIDTWLAFAETIGQTKRYNDFCKANGYVTRNGNLKMTAEICYRFISNNNDFIEEHTAFSDASIEAELLFAIFKTHKKFTRNQHQGNVNKFVRVRG